MHEVVFSDARQKKNGVNTMDIAKRLIDYGFHPYTTAFPMIVPGALMIEPTESESKEECDLFIDAMRDIAEEAATNPDIVKTAPHTTRVRRLDEVGAARKPILRWDPNRHSGTPEPAQRESKAAAREFPTPLVPSAD
jgi:glycine dehydrogenase subunit 2